MTAAEIDVSLAIGDRGLRSFVTAFAITQLVEVPIYMVALRRAAAGNGAARSTSETERVGEQGHEDARDAGETERVGEQGHEDARDAGETEHDEDARGASKRERVGERGRENARDAGENERDEDARGASETERGRESAPADVSAPASMAARGAIAFGASLLTHPIVWFVIPVLVMRLYTICALSVLGAWTLGVMGRTLLYGAFAEGFAVAAEALYLRAFGVRRALAWSVGANAASVVVGTLVVWGLDR